LLGDNDFHAYPLLLTSDYFKLTVNAINPLTDTSQTKSLWLPVELKALPVIRH
jgi:hypothetical protein